MVQTLFTMKKFILILSAFFLVHTTQVQAQSLLDMAADMILGGGNNNNSQGGSRNTQGNTSGLALNNLDISNGLKEALTIGTRVAGDKLSRQNGFFGDQAVKILMPKEARQVESALRSFGFSKLADQLILSMNRAAEDAVKKAVPIFISAIRTISIQDGLSILRGGQHAATDFLRQRTTASLAQAFRPSIESSLGKVNATKYWNSVFSTYNRLPLGQKSVNADLTSYVTEQALKGIFVKVAEQETKIRVNPLSQGSDLLRRVFGGQR